MADMRIEEPPRFRMRMKTKLLLVLSGLALLVLSFALGALFTHRESAPVITSDLIGQQLYDVQELATVAYFYTNMGRFENQVDFYGWKVPFTRKSFIVSYDGVIKAGVDLQEMAIEVTERTISVTLPAAKILSHEIPENSLKVFDETRNIFNPIQIEDYTGFTRDQKSALETRAVENGLLTQASEKAKNAVRALLAPLPGMDTYTLEVQ